MGFKFLILILFFYTTICFSQNEYQKSEDSLSVLINNEVNDTDKINYYVALCDIYKEYDLKKYKNCNEALLKVSKKSNSTKGYGLYYSGKALLSFYATDYKQALEFETQASAFFYKIKDWNNYFISRSHSATFMSLNGEEKKAIALLDTTILNAKRKKSKCMSTLYYDFCYLYTNTNNYTKALKYAILALQMETSDVKKLKIYRLISEIYSQVGNYKKALEYNEIVNKQAKHSLLYYKNKNFKSKILFKLKYYHQAINLALEVREFLNKQGYFSIHINNTYFISKCYYELKNYQLANVYIDEVLKSPLIGRSLKITSNTNKAKICIALKDMKTARKYLDESLNLLKEEDDYEQKINLYKIKEKFEETLGNYKLALLYNRKISAIKETNYISDNNNKLHQLEIDLDVTEKNNRIKNLQIAQLQKQVEINTKSDYIIYISIALLIALASVLVYIKNYNTIKLKNLIIEDEKSLVKKSLLEKETLLKEIHHRVKNNMQLVISLLKIQARDSKELSIENFIEVSENRIRSMALIHEYLYESENINYVNFEEYVNRLSSSIRGSFSNQSTIKLETQINNTHFNIETAIPLGLIINELVINAFKHAFAGKDQGIIKIILFKEQDLHHLEITDNGIGIDTIQENGSSIGLKIVKLLVSQINGQMQIKKNSGTQFTIQFKDINSTHE